MSGYRLFIGQLVKDVRRRELEDAFGKYGEIVRIDIKNGFGFIEYEHSRDAEEAVRKMDGEDFLGRRIIVEYARGKKRERDDRRDYRRDNKNSGPERSEYRVIVEGLARGTSWQDLKDAFRSSGDILFTDVRRDKYDDYYGIVEFRRKDDIDQAIRKMEGAEINGYKIRVKEDRRKKRSRSRSEKRRRRTRSRSNEKRRSNDRKSNSRERSPKKRSTSRDRSNKKRSTSRDRSPRRRTSSRDRSPKKRSNSRDRSPKKRSPSRDRSGSRDRERERSKRRSSSRDSKHRDSKHRDSKGRDSKHRDSKGRDSKGRDSKHRDDDHKNEPERNDDNKDNDKDNEQRDN